MGLYQSAFLEHRLDKASFQAEEPKLRAQLLEAQLALVERRGFPVLILVTGMDGAGKGGVIQRLYEWLDPRHLRTNGYQRVDETRSQPDGSGWQVTTSIAVSVPEAMMRTTSAAPLAVARASRCAEARARNSRGVPAPTSRRMIRPRL